MQCAHVLQMFFNDPSKQEYMGSLRANFNAIVKMDRGEARDSIPSPEQGMSHVPKSENLRYIPSSRLRDPYAQKMENL